MRLRWFLGAALVFPVAAAPFLACSSDEPATPPVIDATTPPVEDATAKADAPAPPPTEKSSCVEYITAFCEKTVECTYPGGLDGCLRNVDLCPEYFFSPGSTRTVASMLACAAEFRKMSCDAFAAGIRPACQTAGDLEAGAPCISPAQCASASCNGFQPGRRCGNCSALYAPDAGCTGDGLSGATVCPFNERCDPTTKKCAPIVVSATVSTNGACSTKPGEHCGFGSSCLASAPGASTGTCGEPPPAGAPCAFYTGSASAACAAGAYCKFSDAKRTKGTCTAFEAVGGACKEAIACGPDAYCKLASANTGVCTAPAALGERCGTVSFDGGVYSIPCATDRCERADGGGDVCMPAPLRRDGDCSAPDARCIDLLECTNGKCEPLDYAACLAPPDAGVADAPSD